MPTRKGDSVDDQKCYDFERRLTNVEKDTERNATAIHEFKIAFKEEQNELKNVVKDLATSNNALATSMVKIESGISTLTKVFPIIAVIATTVIGGSWAYHLNAIRQLEHSQEVQTQFQQQLQQQFQQQNVLRK